MCSGIEHTLTRRALTIVKHEAEWHGIREDQNMDYFVDTAIQGLWVLH